MAPRFVAARSAAPRLVRALAVLAAGALLTLGHAPGALAATAAVTDLGRPAVATAVQAKGYCDPSDVGSVTVVVDFSGVGGGIDVRCSAGSTGQQALANAFSYSEIASQPGFVCQIEGAPAGDCQTTPPGSAYWSYWQAAPGGGWAYSTRGFGSSRVKPGGFEGWAFGSGGAPGIDPVLPAAPEQPAPEPEQPAVPEPEQPEPEQPAAEQPAAGQPAAEPAPDAGAPDDGAAADPTTESATGVDPAAEAAAAAAAAAVQAEAEAAAAAQAAAAAAAASAAAESVAASAAAVSASVSSSAASSSAENSATTSAGGSADLSANESTSGSTIWISVVALLAVASLGTAAVVMSRRRRSGAGDDQAG